MFSWLPLATVIDGKVLVVHGGISNTTDLNVITRMERHKVNHLAEPSEPVRRFPDRSLHTTKRRLMFVPSGLFCPSVPSFYFVNLSLCPPAPPRTCCQQYVSALRPPKRCRQRSAGGNRRSPRCTEGGEERNRHGTGGEGRWDPLQAPGPRSRHGAQRRSLHSGTAVEEELRRRRQQAGLSQSLQELRRLVSSSSDDDDDDDDNDTDDDDSDSQPRTPERDEWKQVSEGK